MNTDHIFWDEEEERICAATPAARDLFSAQEEEFVNFSRVAIPPTLDFDYNPNADTTLSEYQNCNQDYQLEDIEPDTLFQKKKYTELTNVKSATTADVHTGTPMHSSGSDNAYPLLEEYLMDGGIEATCALMDLDNSTAFVSSGDIERHNYQQYLSFNEPLFQGIAGNDHHHSNSMECQQELPYSAVNALIKCEPNHSSENIFYRECVGSPFETGVSSTSSHGVSYNAPSPLPPPPDFSTNDNCPFDCSDVMAECGNCYADDPSPQNQQEYFVNGVFGPSSWVKEIKVGKNNRPRGPKCWEFVLRLLQDSSSNPDLVKWEDPSVGSFRLVEKEKISAIWGNRPSKKKNGKVIKYESFARILRYHYKKGKGMVLPVSEKHLVYKFSHQVLKDFKAGKIL